MTNKTKNAKGFTLIEILFALFIGLLLMGTIYVSMISGQRSSVALEGRITAQQDVRAVLEVMGLEIGMTSYNPNFVTGIWRNPGDCVNASANTAYKGIQVATVNSITVEMDTGESGAVGDSANEIIAYVYDTANERITRQTNCGGAQAFLGDVPANPRSVRVINNTLNIPMLRYFDGMGVEIPAGSLPAGIPNIRRIEITLAVETEDIDPNTMGRRRMIYSTSVISRNHAIIQ
jgi:prepilin-type N-terminal cleavage/methylation domain-containing protein